MSQILILEDYPPLRRALALTLQRAGCHVALAQSACEALGVVHQQACVVLLVDIENADRDIWRVLRALSTTHKSVPIVALLYPESEEHKELEAFGVRFILPKPVGREALLSGIELALRELSQSL